MSLNKITIGYFGRVVPEKGIHHLIQALSNLKFLNWILVMDEFSEYTSNYHSQIHSMINNLGILDRIRFISPNHYEIAEYMNAVDIVCLPSVSTKIWIEQYGRVIPEAMACGKKVIASNTGAIPMLLNEFGTLFPEGEVSTLSSILREIISGEKTCYSDYSAKEISDYAHKELSIEKQKELMLNFIK